MRKAYDGYAKFTDRENVMSITVLLMQMIKLFALMCLGFVLYKINIIDDHTRTHMTKFVLFVTTPALIINSFVENIGIVGKGAMMGLFGMAFAMYVILAAIAVVIVFAMRIEKSRRGMYMFMTVFANVGFMGFPVVEALYGTQGVFYTAIFNCMFNLFVYTLGVFLVNYGQESRSDLKSVLNLKKLLNPGVLCCLVSVVIFLAEIPVHPVINDLLGSVGGLTSTLAMLLVGSSLAVMNPRELFGDVTVYVYTLIKQIAIPFLMWPLIHIFMGDGMLAAVTLVMAAMPVANSAVLFATEYGGDEKLACRTIFITTVLSMATIPAVVSVCL